MYDPKAECEADALHFVVKTNTINLIPTANVVEGEKIDKAIEEGYEIRKSILRSNDNYTVNDVLDIIDEILEPFEELYKE